MPLPDFCNPTDTDDFYAPPPPPETPPPPPGADPKGANPNLKNLSDELGKQVGDNLAEAVSAVKKQLEDMVADGQKAYDNLFELEEGIAKFIGDLRQEGSFWVAHGLTLPASVFNRLLTQKFTLGDLKGMVGDLNTLLGDLNGKFNLVDPKNFQGILDFKAQHLDGMLKNTDEFLKWMQGGFDPAQILGGLTDMFDRWLPDSGLTAFLKGTQKFMADANGWISKGAEMLALAQQYLEAGRAMVLAGCQLGNSLRQYVDYAKWVAANIGMIALSFVADLLPKANPWFELPKPPGFDQLKGWEGLPGKLAAFEAAFACPSPDAPQEEEEEDPNANPVSKVIEKLTKSLSETMSKALSGGMLWIKSLMPETAVPNPFDPERAANESQDGANKLQPPRPPVLPDEAAILGFLTMSATMIGFGASIVTKLFKIGAGKVAEGALSRMSLDGEPVVPSAGRTMSNLAGATVEIVSHVKSTDDIIKDCNSLAGAAQTAGTSNDPAALAAALAAGANALARSIGSVNLAVNENLENPSQTAIDHEACRTGPEGSGAGDTEPTQEEVEDGFKGIPDAPPGCHNSPCDIICGHRPPEDIDDPDRTGPPTLDEILEQLPGGVLPGGVQDDGMEAVMQNPSEEEQALLALMFLIHTLGEKTSFFSLLNLWETLRSLLTNPELQAAHAGLKEKAIQQGYFANSPYTWLYEGALTLPENEDPVTWFERFLKHDLTADIRPFAYWITSTDSRDEQVPLPSGLTQEELQAAQLSMDFYVLKGQDVFDFLALLIAMRQRADFYGKALGYEFFLAVTAMLYLMKCKASILAGEPEETFAVWGDKAKAAAEKLTQKDLVLSGFAGLISEE